MKKVKMHSGCLSQANVALRRAEPPAAKCRCKKLIDYTEANTLVKQGAAKWVVTKRTQGTEDVPCMFCASMTDVEKKTCSRCHGTGVVTETRIWEEFNNDIVLLGDDREGFKEKTPRVATIEPKHINLLLDNVPYAIERIKEYASMIQEALGEFGAEIRDGKTGLVVKEGTREPKDEVKGYPPGSITFSDGTKNKTWYWTVEGRNRDYGRAI